MSKTAIDAQRSNVFMLLPENLTLITDETHPLFDPRANDPADEAMVCNVMVYGVLEPVLARKNGEAIEVIAGRGRTKAALEANRRLAAEGKQSILVPVMLKKGQDSDLYGILITENSIRREDSPMLKSVKANKLLNMGHTVQQIAVTFGVSRQTIDNWLALQDLAPELQQAVEDGEVSATAAAKLAQFDREEQVERYEGLKEQDQPMTVSTLESAARSKDNIPSPRLKKRKEVEQALTDTVPSDERSRGYREALLWMLGRTEEDSF